MGDGRQTVLLKPALARKSDKTKNHKKTTNPTPKKCVLLPGTAKSSIGVSNDGRASLLFLSFTAAAAAASIVSCSSLFFFLSCRNLGWGWKGVLWLSKVCFFLSSLFDYGCDETSFPFMVAPKAALDRVV